MTAMTDDVPRIALFGEGHAANDPITSGARKIIRAMMRGTGTCLTAAECYAFDFGEGGGDWWEEQRAVVRDALLSHEPERNI